MNALHPLPQLLGVIHLPPLPGAPGTIASRALQEAGLRAVSEAQVLAKAGFDGLILENFGDTPFYKDRVPPETVASLAIIAAAVREAVSIPIGINVLRNDARAALAIAAVSGCNFIRVNVLSGVAATDQGMIEGEAAYLIRERERLGANHVAILGDVHVKHAQSLSSSDITLGVEEVALRSRADGVIVTGATTGRSVNPADLAAAGEIARAHRIPLYVGSGATVSSLAELMQFASGVIVGSALREKGQAGAPLDLKAIRAFVQAFRARKRAPRKIASATQVAKTSKTRHSKLKKRPKPRKKGRDS